MLVFGFEESMELKHFSFGRRPRDFWNIFHASLSRMIRGGLSNLVLPQRVFEIPLLVCMLYEFDVGWVG
jgi:hypothetical protein